MFNYEGDIIITGSKDNSCRVWKDKQTFKFPEEGVGFVE